VKPSAVAVLGLAVCAFAVTQVVRGCMGLPLAKVTPYPEPPPTLYPLHPTGDAFVIPCDAAADGGC
jgi:hypothetical protein